MSESIVATLRRFIAVLVLGTLPAMLPVRAAVPGQRPSSLLPPALALAVPQCAGDDVATASVPSVVSERYRPKDVPATCQRVSVDGPATCEHGRLRSQLTHVALPPPPDA
jgi:hypothetical protein